MPIHFERKEEIRLANPPLAEVVCQVRFTPILQIAKETPSDFQERIRDRFPILKLERKIELQVPGPGNLDDMKAEASPKLFRFHSKDEQTAVSLTLDFFALSTHRYEGWTRFSEALQAISEAVDAIYRPAFATRIGLRYINRFTKANTGCESMREVFDLFQPQLTSLLREAPWSEPEEMLSQVSLTNNGEKLALRIGYSMSDEEPSFLLDLDYFETGKLDIEQLLDTVSSYHEMIYDAFRWAILDDSLDRFDPI